MNRSFLISLLLALSMAQIPSAFADTLSWVVVPVTTGAMPAVMEDLIADLRQELERQGRRTWSQRSATAQFERRGSRAAERLSREELERWTDDSLAGIRSLSVGDHASALKHLARAERLSRSAREELNREPGRAQRVLDTCLYMVRALLETDDATSAAERAAGCLQLVPRRVPAGLMHPPEVMDLYELARASSEAHGGTLRVESRSSQCAVRINGILFGRTPLLAEGLPSGEYGIQVECAGRGRSRIHRADLDARGETLFVNPEFDRAVRTDPVLRLEYPQSRGAASLLVDAKEITDVLPADAVVLVSAPGRGDAIVDLVARDGTRRGCARVPLSPKDPDDDGALSLAVSELIRGQCMRPSASSQDSSRLFRSGI